MDPLADIAVFVRVVEHGSFTAAAEALELSKAAAESDVAQLTAAPRGLLRISAPTYLGSVRLAPALKDFRARYPDVTLDLQLDDRLVDLVHERFDVAVRIAPSLDPALVARRLTACPLIVVAAPHPRTCAAMLRRGCTPTWPRTKAWATASPGCPTDGACASRAAAGWR